MGYGARVKEIVVCAKTVAFGGEDHSWQVNESGFKLAESSA